jgi:hypothetical protein
LYILPISQIWELGNEGRIIKPGWTEAASQGDDDTLTGLASLSNAGTERRCEKPNQQEGFLQ